jgi:hypothetical protein
MSVNAYVETTDGRVLTQETVKEVEYIIFSEAPVNSQVMTSDMIDCVIYNSRWDAAEEWNMRLIPQLRAAGLLKG